MAIEWAPSVGNVAALLRARTKVSTGNEAGTFNDETRPTIADVRIIIDNAVADVATALRIPRAEALPQTHWAQAKSLAAIRTAMLIELSFFPEQIRSDVSPYAEFKSLYDESLASMKLALSEEKAELAKINACSDDATATTNATAPYWDFTQGVNVGVAGWGSRW